MKILDNVYSITYGKGFISALKMNNKKQISRIIISFGDHTKTYLADGRMNYFSEKDLFKNQEEAIKHLINVLDKMEVENVQKNN